jgi:hypothetical protein
MEAAKSAAPRLMACSRGEAAAISSTCEMPAALSMMTSKADFLGAPHRRLDRGDQRIDRVDIGGTAHLGDHDLVKPLTRLFQQVHHVAIPPGAIEPVDPHREGLLAPIHLVDRLDRVGAGGLLVGGGHGIFEVDIDNIRSGRGHFLEELSHSSQGRKAGSGWDGQARAAGCGNSWNALFSIVADLDCSPAIKLRGPLQAELCCGAANALGAAQQASDRCASCARKKLPKCLAFCEVICAKMVHYLRNGMNSRRIR